MTCGNDEVDGCGGVDWLTRERGGEHAGERRFIGAEHEDDRFGRKE